MQNIFVLPKMNAELKTKGTVLYLQAVRVLARGTVSTLYVGVVCISICWCKAEQSGHLATVSDLFEKSAGTSASTRRRRRPVRGTVHG